ncbi:Ubiquinone biosynthesis protein UbiV [Gammaproteobacteria bacterium]
MKLSLGPISYYWSSDTLVNFYEQVANWPVDIVYLGETICSKRRSLSFQEWLEVGERLTAAGKEVVLSTLSLLEAESELKTLRRICENGRFLVEANDMAAVNLLTNRVPFITGPSVNLYNAQSLRLLHSMGLRRWVLPVELSRSTLTDIQIERPEGLEVEVQVYGRLPLSMSARCFTARAHNLPKDDCQCKCLDYPEGMLLHSQENQPFLILNGVQIQSALTYHLVTELADLAHLQVDVARISPLPEGTDRVVSIFREVMNGTRSPQSALVETSSPLGTCVGYWRGQAGIQ